MTTFQDIFKSNFLENVTSVTVLDMVLAIVLAFSLGCSSFLSIKKPTAACCTLPVLGCPSLP